VGGKCVCATPMPVDGACGWIGDKCDQEVHLLPANGTAAKASLDPLETKCWATRLPSHDSPTANFFSIMGSLAKDSSAVDLHGLVATPTAWHVNASLKYPNSSMDWDYSNSIEPGPLSRLQLLGDAAQHSQRFGLYLCATPQKDSQASASITLSAEGHACLDDCNNWRGGKPRGTCQKDGRCACEAHWLGATCDVAAPNTTSTKCVPGSTLPEHTKDSTAPGTCWRACNEDTGAYEEHKCADFTCDPVDANGNPQRRKGDEEACVTDHCTPGTRNMYPDVSGNFVCQKKCSCPSDGSSCEVDPTCLPDTMQCLNGLVLIKHQDGSTECGPSTELSCEEGTLRQDFSFEGGSVYGVCVCGAAAKARAGLRAVRAPEGPNCTFTSPLPPPSPKDPVKPEGGVVMCNPGHELLNAKPNSIVLSNGRKLQGGGRCVPISNVHKGVSPPLVFLWCLFSVALGPALVVLARRVYIWHQARQVQIGDDEEGLGASLLGHVRTGWETVVDGIRGLFSSGGGGGTRDRGYGDADPNSW